MTIMYNAPHPGELLKEYLDEISVTDAAKALGVTRANLSRILNGHTGISADMAIRLSFALDTTPEFWLNLQTQYDLWVASQQERPEIHSLFAFA
ncbi:HigA family addiction module antitoxin [Acinetobacter stercoris]|uniref:Putative HTH-type transcriptional regulator YddM n=1 Tax=Acinetobacter stercoris TaxID=2126983 RepID=A0A2U3MUP3_9GAMM|nr:HigA family addiction module antitoxin [Acinetobacter stercoris]SPL69146.1 putative HTH-type transcriptional regulator YddM [Acinetobacter stercoris]